MRSVLKMFALVLALSVVSGCGKSGPCSGGGMELDKRELPKDWAALATPPEGAIACHQADGSTDAEYSRHFEVGGSPDEGFHAWQKALTAQGWTQVSSDVANERGYEYVGERDGAKILVYVSKAVEGKGWTSIDFTPAK